MGERRALLDPEMYKISEEDSQDEEVLSAGALAGYAEEALKLGEEATTISSWNNNVPPPVLPPRGWETEGSIDNRNYVHDDNRYVPQASSSFSSAMHRFGGGGVSKYKVLHGQGQTSSLSTGNLSRNKFSLPVHDPEGDCVDWPDTSTNSDSCLSGDDRGLNKRQPWVYGSDFDSAANNNKFISRTYFGDHVRKRTGGDGSSFTYLDGEEEPNTHSLGMAHNLQFPPQHQQQSQNNRRHFQKRSRRRSNVSVQHGANFSGSSSGSEYTDESSEESLCTDCRSTGRPAVMDGRDGEGQSESSSDDYGDESSYSESSFDEYDEDEDEFENENFEDIVKFLSDNELESSTNADGDLFLVEYSAESEMSDNDQASHRISVSSRELTPQIESDTDLQETPERQLLNPSDLYNEKGVKGSSTGSSPPSTSGTHFQKSGKGAKGKISRLLKRRKDVPNKIRKDEVDKSPQSLGPSTSTTIPEVEQNGSSQTSPKISSSQSLAKLPASSSTLLSSIAKQKKRLGTKTSSDQSSTQPEKVFRFKDEHGGETRTVFVDVPQSDGSGNLLGRRATLIESILGILPGRFSTPAQTSVDITEQNGDRIMVAGFVPDGVASRYRRIKIGDWLQSVDDIPVDHANVDQVLSTRSMYGKRRTAFETEYLRLKLTLTRVAGCMVSLPLKNDANRDSIRSSSHVSTELKWSTVSPNVQSNMAILYISIGHGGNDAESGDNGDTSNSGTDAQNSQPANETLSSTQQQKNGHSKEKSKDIVFCWPKESESKILKALLASHGMFSTLYRLLLDVTGSHPLTSRVLIDDAEVDVTYTSDDHGKSLLLVAISTSLSSYNVNYRHPYKTEAAGSSLTSPEGTSGDGKKKEKKIRWREPQGGGSNVTNSQRVLTRLENLLKYQFGSFAKAFKEDSKTKASRVLINAISALNDLSEDFLFPQVPGNFLRFPNCIRSGIDDVLYSFETSDTIYSSTKNSPRKSNANDTPVFHCHGSCLMYKGFLVTSHLENDLASSFHGWWRTQLGLWEGVKRSSLLERWKPVSRLALWQQTSLPCSNALVFELETNEDPIGSKPSLGHSRTFSAVVGIGNFTLGFVLEHLTDFNGRVGPDSGWIRRAMATICRLYQSGLSRSFECWLEKQGDKHEFVELSGYSPTSSSKHYKHSGSSQVSPTGKSKTGTANLKKTGTTGSILKNADSVHLHSMSCPVHTGSITSSSSSASSTCSCPSTQNSSSQFSASTMKTFIGASSLSLGGVRSGIAAQLQQQSMLGTSAVDSVQGGNEAGESDGDDDTTTGSDNSSFKWYETTAAESSFNSGSGTSGGEVKSIRVTRGNLLFDYLQIEFGRGVILSSKDVHEGWAAIVRHNFRQSVTIIHNILHKAAKARNRLEERGQDKKWVSKALAPISEHGILFNCQITEPRDLHKRKPRKREVNYWVVGRIYPEEREIYVCYEDGPLSQNLVELAYKIALNVHC